MACAGEKSYSNSTLADFGGKHGSPAKQYLTTSHITGFSPVLTTLSDEDMSDKINFLNNL
jgi:hypothetical protein